MEFCVVQAGVLTQRRPRVSPGSVSNHGRRKASIISHGQTLGWTWNIDMAFKMWGMNMIYDTYLPRFAAALHVAGDALAECLLQRLLTAQMLPEFLITNIRISLIIKQAFNNVNRCVRCCFVIVCVFFLHTYKSVSQFHN